MTDILCRWLNEDVKLSLDIEKENVSKVFSSGYLFGEILYKYGLQDDFSSFSKGRTMDSKLNNFTRIESVMKLLEIPYDTNVARSVMNENHGAATKLLYQLFIALGRKAKKNLTGVAMETMRPSAPVKLEGIESAMHKERLKQLVPRQVDVNFETLVERYQTKQKLQEDMAAKKKQEEEMKVRKYQQDLRQRGLEKSRLARDKQNEVMQKIRDARVRIPKPPESKKSTKTKQEIRKEMEIQEVKDHISSFEESMRTNLPPQSSLHLVNEFEGQQDLDLENKLLRKPLQPIALKTAGDDYVSKIKKRLNEDAVARKEREKRRRRVLIEQLRAHEAQEEQRREEMLVKRLMRQSQQEKRIAVQLMQIRHEKQVIKENRIFREEQYAERRLKDFEDALNREAEMCRLAQIEYGDEIQKAENERKELLEERRKEKYEKHYEICQQILSDIVDYSCKIGEYRELTEGDVPEKLIREWKGYFDVALPLYPHEILTEEEIARSKERLVEEEKNKLTDECDFTEYRAAVGEWEPGDDAVDQIPPKDNPILGHIIQKLFNIIYPPEPPPPTPEFPPFPIKACFLGKFFSGKTTAVERLIASHRVVRLCIDDLVEDATEAYQSGETTEEIVENTEPQNIDENEDKQVAEAEATNVSEEIHEETKENQDPNNATVPETTEVRDCGDSQGTGNGLEEKKSFYIVRKATSRAILGEKAFEYLKKGKQIPDQLLVDITVDAIRQVPAGTGWILDGFPSTIAQAKILEKSLTGYDASKEVKPKETKGRGKKSRIAPDPHPAVETPPPKSGIDIVVLFDVSDDVVLRRAEGRTYNPTNSEVFHQEFNPPSDGSYTGLGKQEKVLPVVDPSNDREQVQQRITGFDDSWSKLEKWFNKFGILTKVDVDNTIDDVYEHVSTLLVETTERIHGPPKEDTNGEVTEASIEVTHATPENEIVEVVNTAVDEPIETHEDVEAAKENTKTVSPKSSKKISKKDRSPSPPNKPVSPKSSKKNLRPGSKKSSPSPSRKASRIKSPTASRTDTKRAKSPVKKQDVPEELPVEPVLPPGPEPGSKEWEYVDQPIDMPLVTILADRWENLEKTYIETSKNVFREIRQERELIYRYFYGTRKEFLSFLRRPDEKEEYVLQWQNHYNEVSEDMRGDDEVKAELHQEVDDLCDRLYEICDNRKEMAESERTVVMEEGWLQDRLGLLTNHYLTLMQVEVDRYQDTYRVLKDYYNSAEGKNPVEAYTEICRIPLIDLPAIIPTVPSSGSEHGSQYEVKQTSSKKDRENIKTPEGPTSEGEDHRIPLVPRRPKSGDVSFSKEKKDKRSSKDKRDKAENQSETPVLPTDPDERLVFDGFYNALAIIEILANLEQAEQEEEANKLAEAMKEREKEKEKEKDVGKKGGKDKKQEKKGKKSANKANKQETPPPAPPSSEGENEEEKLKKEIKEKNRKEFLAAVQFEDISLRTRLEMIRNRSVTVLQELKMKADLTYKDMDDWLGARFLQEVDSIRAMADLARTAIENEQKLQQQLILEDKDFVVDWDLNVFRTPSPTPPPSPKEQTSSDNFTVVQLEHLYNQFVEAAPSGLISCRAFVDIFLDLMSTSFGMEMLPDIWINQTGVQLHSLTTFISQDSEFVDWKKFLILASSPLPMPSRDELFNTLSRFMNIDVEKTGLVSEQQFLQLNLWFSDDSEHEDGPVYPRVKYLKQLLFKIFSDTKEGPPMLNYENFLLYFAMDANPVEGILRALTIVCYQTMPSSSLFQNEPTVKDTGTAYSVVKDFSSEVGGNALITLQDFVKVFHHGGNEFSDRQRFQGSEHSPFSKDRLCGVFMELGGNETESLPFYILYQHPIIEDCIQICQRFKHHNLHNLLKCERYPASINEGH